MLDNDPSRWIILSRAGIEYYYYFCLSPEPVIVKQIIHHGPTLKKSGRKLKHVTKKNNKLSMALNGLQTSQDTSGIQANLKYSHKF